MTFMEGLERRLGERMKGEESVKIRTRLVRGGIGEMERMLKADGILGSSPLQ